MQLAARKRNTDKPVTGAAFTAALETLHAKMDAGFAQVGRRFDRVEGEIRVMRQDIGELRQDVAEIRSDVAVLKGDVEVLKGDVAVLKDDVAVLKGDVAVLKEDVAVLKDDMGRVKDASMQHTRELSALRTNMATKVDPADLEPLVERVLARRGPPAG